MMIRRNGIRGCFFMLPLALMLALTACGGSGGGVDGVGTTLVTLDWIAPTMRSDGTTEVPSRIESYNIYYGIVEDVYTGRIVVEDETLTSSSVEVPIIVQNVFVAMSVVDVDGRESALSAPVTKSPF